MTQPNQPSVAQERFGRSLGRLTASQVIETCATILAGVILLGLAWTNPQPYAPVDLIAGLSGAAALIVGVRLLQAPLIYGTVILIVSTVTVLWPWRAEFSRHYRWVWLALGGIILIVAAARYEASLKSMRTIAAGCNRWIRFLVTSREYTGTADRCLFSSGRSYGAVPAGNRQPILRKNSAEIA